MLYANQHLLFDPDTASRRALKQIAKNLDLDTKAFNKCFNDREHRQDVEREKTDGQAKGVDSTPMIFVNDINPGYPRTFEEIQQVIEEELAKVSQ